MFNHSPRRLLPFAAAIGAFLVALPAMGAEPTPRPAKSGRHALLVGVNQYDSDKLAALSFAVNDAAQTAEVLGRHGYEVTLLSDDTGGKDPKLLPTRENVERALTDLFGRYDEQKKRTEGGRFTAGDTVIIGFAGHGMQFGKEAYFCPKDAIPTMRQAGTLIGLSRIYALLEEAPRGVKLILVDACRDDGARGSRGIDGEGMPAPPRGIGVLLSCSEGERSFEHPQLKHGVFFDRVIKGLEGEAQDRDTGEVTWDSLRAYVKKQVPGAMAGLFQDGRLQQPNEIGNLSGVPPVLVAFAVRARPSDNAKVDAPMPEQKGGERAAVAKAPLGAGDTLRGQCEGPFNGRLVRYPCAVNVKKVDRDKDGNWDVEGDSTWTSPAGGSYRITFAGKLTPNGTLVAQTYVGAQRWSTWSGTVKGKTLAVNWSNDTGEKGSFAVEVSNP
jgi:hypothetical protein